MEYILLLGAGPLNLGGYIVTHLTYFDSKIIVITRDVQKFENAVKDVIINQVKEYTLVPLDEDNFNNMKNMGSRVIYYTDINCPFIKRVINSAQCCISACRSGLCEYVQKFEELINPEKELTIYVMDNNPIYIQSMKKRNRCKNIEYFSIVAHAAVSKMIICEGHVYINADSKALFVYPPCSLSQYIFSTRKKRTWLWDSKKIILAENEDDFIFHKLNKIVSINAQHTFQCILATEKGYSRGETMEDIQEKTFEEYLSKEEAMEAAKKLHLVAYCFLLLKMSDNQKKVLPQQYIIGYSQHYNMMMDFIDFIYSSKDKIRRGIDIKNQEDLNAKYERHVILLQDACKILQSESSAIENVLKLMAENGACIDKEILISAIQFCLEVIRLAKKFYCK